MCDKRPDPVMDEWLLAHAERESRAAIGAYVDALIASLTQQTTAVRAGAEEVAAALWARAFGRRP